MYVCMYISMNACMICMYVCILYVCMYVCIICKYDLYSCMYVCSVCMLLCMYVQVCLHLWKTFPCIQRSDCMYE
jgi:hypothetical protein